MFNSPVLLVSRDADIVETVREVVSLVPGCRCFMLGQVEQALEFLADSPATLCIYHATDSNRESLEWLLKDLRAGKRSEATLVITDDERPEALLNFLRNGVADCLSRPLDRSRLRFLIDSLTFRARHASNPAANAAEVDPLAVDGDGAFHESGMGRLMQVVRKAARQDSTVLLTGPTGVGKTRLARVIHGLSPRQKEPFLTVNCAALPENLLESELFGHCKGSFTGAEATRTGRFAAVGGGTLLLDDVDALPLVLQKKLLRAVDERVFEPVGSNRSQPLEARLIVATNRNLTEEIAAGTFRSDLYYRLNIIELTLPPLRQRRHAIPAIAESYLRECAARNNRPVPGVSPHAWDALVTFDWPGNIRELRNAIERALALCDDRMIVLDDLPEIVQAFSRERTRDGSFAQSEQPGRRVVVPSPASATAAITVNGDDAAERHAAAPLSPLAQARAEAELERIKHALQRTGNNRTRASAELGISRVALYKKLRRFGLLDFSAVPAS